MLIWFQLNYIPSVECIIPKDTDSESKLVGFHLSIPMGYMESVPLFCATMEKIKDTVNNAMHKIGKAPVHPLDILEETPPGDDNQI